MFNSKQQTPQAATVLRQAAANQAEPPTNTATPAASGVVHSIKLSRAINTHKGLVSELSLRAPTMSDYIANGDIDTVVATGIAPGVAVPTALETKVNYEGLMKWAVSLSGLDRLVLDQLSPEDAGHLFRQVRIAVAPFAQGNSPAAPTS